MHLHKNAAYTHDVVLHKDAAYINMYIYVYTYSCAMDSADNTFTIVEYNNHQITMQLIRIPDKPDTSAKLDTINYVSRHHSNIVRKRSRSHHRRHNDQ